MSTVTPVPERYTKFAYDQNTTQEWFIYFTTLLNDNGYFLPRSLSIPFLETPKPGDEGVDGADVSVPPAPRLEREDTLFAEGDKAPFNLPEIMDMEIKALA